jgi:hypothetical protein
MRKSSAEKKAIQPIASRQANTSICRVISLSDPHSGGGSRQVAGLGPSLQTMG